MENENRKDILVSIRPEWIKKIASGEKTVEVRKSEPNIPSDKYTTCYIYETKYDNGRGMIVGEFTIEESNDGCGRLYPQFKRGMTEKSFRTDKFDNDFMRCRYQGKISYWKIDRSKNHHKWVRCKKSETEF